MTSDLSGSVAIPAGLPLDEAAAWVGHACWAELRLHGTLTGWLAVESDPRTSATFWRLRADTAARAEAWFHRLPELRERPREAYVAPSSDAVVALFAELDALDDPADRGRPAVLAAVLLELRRGYHRHRAHVTGPADGPVATTLAAALRSTFDVDHVLVDPAWTERTKAAGGLP